MPPPRPTRVLSLGQPTPRAAASVPSAEPSATGQECVELASEHAWRPHDVRPVTARREPALDPRPAIPTRVPLPSRPPRVPEPSIQLDDQPLLVKHAIVAPGRGAVLTDTLRQPVWPQHPAHKAHLQHALSTSADIREHVNKVGPQPMPRPASERRTELGRGGQPLRAGPSHQIDGLVECHRRQVGAVQDRVFDPRAPWPGELVDPRFEVPRPMHHHPRRRGSAPSRHEEVRLRRHTSKSVEVCRALVRQRGRLTHREQRRGHRGQRVVTAGAGEVDARIGAGPATAAHAMVDDLPAEPGCSALRMREQVELLRSQPSQAPLIERLARAPGRAAEDAMTARGE